MQRPAEETRRRRHSGAPPAATGAAEARPPIQFAETDALFGVDAVLGDLERGEPPIRLQDVPKHPLVPRRSGRAVHLSVPYRWIKRGIKGQRLESCRCGGSICTSASALIRFFRRTSAADEPAGVRMPSRRQDHVARVDEQLANAGL